MQKKKELDLQVMKISGKKTETTENKIHKVSFQGLEKKKYKNEQKRLLTSEINKVFWEIASTQLK